METKTYHQIEKTRFANLMVGFCFVSGIVLALFSWRSPSEIKEKTYRSMQSENLIVQRDEDVVEPPKPETPQVNVSKEQPAPEIDLTNDITTTKSTNQNESEVIFTQNTNIDNNTSVGDGDGDFGIPDVLIEPIVEFPDIEASFVGGELAMRKWMVDNLKYPELAIENNEQGRVFLKFIVEKDGTITHVEVIKSSSALLDYEAKRIIRAMPKWIPGESGGKKVRSSFTMPINFQLN